MNEFLIEGPKHVVVRNTASYGVSPLPSPMSLVIWRVEKGEIISGQGTSVIEVHWHEQGLGQVTVEIIPPGAPPQTTHIVVVVDPVNEQTT